MFSVYNNLIQVADLFEGNVKEEVKNYKEDKNPVTFSYIFCSYFGYVKTVLDMYNGLTNEDKVSFALEELHKALINFDESRGVKVETLFIKYLKNRLRVECLNLNNKIRRANYMANSYDEMIETGYDIAGFDEMVMVDIKDLINSMGLSDLENKYCNFVIEGGRNDSDIARELNVTPAMVTYIKKRLQNKITVAI